MPDQSASPTDAPDEGTTTLVARFAVTGWEPAELPGLGDGWVGAVTMRKEYTAGIVGSSIAHFVSSGDEGGRAYVAAERVTGRLEDGREGSFTVYHGAQDHPDDDSAFGWIIPTSGTGDLVGISGSARIRHDEQGPSFEFTLRA